MTGIEYFFYLFEILMHFLEKQLRTKNTKSF